MTYLPRQAELSDGTRLRNFSMGSSITDPDGPGYLQWQTVDDMGIATHWQQRYASFIKDPDTDPAYNDEPILVLRFDFVGEPEVIATSDWTVPMSSLLPENRRRYVSVLSPFGGYRCRRVQLIEVSGVRTHSDRQKDTR